MQAICITDIMSKYVSRDMGGFCCFLLSKIHEGLVIALAAFMFFLLIGNRFGKTKIFSEKRMRVAAFASHRKSEASAFKKMAK
jgi:hypothetical protein